MPDQVHQLAPPTENAKRLEVALATTLTVSGIPTEQAIMDLAQHLRGIPNYAVSDEEFAAIIKRLHVALTIDMGIGTFVAEDHAPWLGARKAEIVPFYWSRYQTELRKQGWAPKVVASLDRVTDEILDLMADPAGQAGWPRRGLVMGDVQSGKTSNYTGLICKAADAGYKLVILLTGTLESLRRQTQERLDAGFVGLDSSGVVSRTKRRREIGVGLINSARAAGVFTSSVADFKAATVNQLGFRLKDYAEPVLLVVKKNKRILENLTEWLTTFNAAPGGHIELPLLLIDDEADNASVNTNPKKATAINSAIRGLLRVFPKSAYVGFTATPFANVFINPETTDEMNGDDLFPRDFIYALDAPNNYVSADLIFGDDSELDCLRTIDDADSSFPRTQRAQDVVTGLPATMIEALRTFLVANAVMDLRQGVTVHRSMLVNVSHYTLIQDQVRELLDVELRHLQEDIRNYAMLSEQEAMSCQTLADLRATFDREYGGSGTTWPEVQAALTAATLPIIVRSVNQKSGAASLDYTVFRATGLRVVAVGGNSLARGLTLEGLCISYFYRSTQMYDALLQMGRWFGYRNGYRDLFRIWMTTETADWYSHVASATEELRSAIRRMAAAGLKPIDFGLKVRASPESLALKITARNKMRDSQDIVHTMSISGEGLESARLTHDATTLASNHAATRVLVGNIIESGVPRADLGKGPVLWKGVEKGIVVEFLKRFITHPLDVQLGSSSQIAEFIRDSGDSQLALWDVAIPGQGSNQIDLIDGLKVSLRKRSVLVSAERRSVLINGQKMRVGSPADEKAGMTEEQIRLAEEDFRSFAGNESKKTVPAYAYRARRTAPLLLIHVLDPFLLPFKEGEDQRPYALQESTRMVAIGLSFPQLSQKSERVTYTINMVELRNLLAGETTEEDEDDDEDFENDIDA